MEESRQANLKIKLDIANALMAADHHQSNRLVFRMIELSKTPNMRFEIFTELLMELKNYAFNHYAREESFMEMCNYSEMDEHRASHKLHLVELSKVLDTVRKGDQPGVNKLMRSIFNGWQKHRSDQDKKLIDHIHMLIQ